MIDKKIDTKKADDVTRNLTLRQKRFADQYIITGNKAEAARRAGYSSKTAKEQSTVLFNNVAVRAYMSEVLNRQEENDRMEVAEAQRQITSAARGEWEEEVIVMETHSIRKPYLDDKGKTKYETITETVGVVKKKHISARDRLEAYRRYIELMGIREPYEEQDAPRNTDDHLLEALSKRSIVIDVPEGATHEEEEDHASTDTAK